MRGIDLCSGEGSLVEKRAELAGLGESGGPGEYLAVVGPAFAGEQREQGEDSGVGGATEGERGREWEPHPRQLRAWPV